MWEIIEANRRKSLIIFFAMGICLLSLGYFIGQAWWGIKHGGVTGLTISVIIWIGWSLVSYFSGDSIILAANDAREADKDNYPQLYNIVYEMKIAANLPTLPRIYVIDSLVPNAFATGRGPESSTIAVTHGLMTILNRDELQGVIAHEMSHIINRDILLLTFAGVMMGSVQLISDIFLRSIRFRRFDSDSRSSNSSAIAMVLALLAPLATTAMYFAVSRQREYLADASAVRLTRYPEGLASALTKISSLSSGGLPLNKLTAPMYINNPLNDGDDSAGFMDTHPPISERIRILRAMAGNADYAEYQNAFSRVHNGQTLGISSDEKPDTEAIPIRERQPDTRPVHTSNKDVAAASGSCISIGQKAVGLTPHDHMPYATETAAGAEQLGTQPILPKSGNGATTYGSGISTGQRSTEPVPNTDDRPPQEYIRTHKTWDILSCIACGATKEISPEFCEPFFVCHKCGRKIYVKYLPDGR